MIIDFIDEVEIATPAAIELVKKVLTYVAEQEGIEKDAELSISFVSDEEIQEINRTYRGKDQPTDVISFAMQEQGEGEIQIVGEDFVILGDIIISMDRTKEQAAEYGHSFERELAFLATHGLLHLIGYDHMTEEDEKEMFAKQEKYLQAVGLPRRGE